MTEEERILAIEQEQAVFEARRAEIERTHRSGHVVFQGGEVVQVCSSWREAFDAALEKFGRWTPFLIKQIGVDETVRAPALVLGLMDSRLP